MVTFGKNKKVVLEVTMTADTPNKVWEWEPSSEAEMASMLEDLAEEGVKGRVASWKYVVKEI